MASSIEARTKPQSLPLEGEGDRVAVDEVLKKER